jgi:HSP20 family molecular chaperone IbpA
VRCSSLVWAEAHAEVNDGVLTLKLPKAEASKARKIAIA